MTTIWALLQQRRRAAAGAPVVTFVDADGARVELSATSLENAAAKTANALADEFDLEAGARVALLLPVHWQRAAWLAGCWTAGCEVRLPSGPDDADDADLLVTTADALPANRSRPPVAAVSLHPLGLTVPGSVPAGVLDATVVVRSAPDAFLGVPPAGTSAAIEMGGTVIDQAHVVDLAQTKAAAWGLAPGGRLLVGPGADPLDAWLAALAVPLATTASVVLVDGEHDLDRLAAQERVTATLAR